MKLKDASYRDLKATLASPWISASKKVPVANELARRTIRSMMATWDALPAAAKAGALAKAAALAGGS